MDSVQGRARSPQMAYRSPLLQHEVFEEPYPGFGVYGADLLQRRCLIFRFLSTLCGTVRGQQLRNDVANPQLGLKAKKVYGKA